MSSGILDLEGEFNDWSDLRKFDEEPISWNNLKQQDEKPIPENTKNLTDNNKEQPDNTGNNNANQTQPNTGSNNANQTQHNTGNTNANQTQHYVVTDWNDLRKFDDDHDDDWFKIQEKKLGEQYGGNFIKVKYADHGRIAYYCELCIAECNAKKSLQLHCNGMKHLKKKDLWEKEGKPQAQVPVKLGDNKDDRPPPPKKRSPPRRRGQQGPSMGWGASRSRSPPSPRRGWGHSRSRSPPPFYGSRYDSRRDGEPPFFRSMDYDRGDRFDPPSAWSGGDRSFVPLGMRSLSPDRFPRRDDYGGDRHRTVRYPERDSIYDRMSDRDPLPGHKRLARYDEPATSRRAISPDHLPRFSLDQIKTPAPPSPPKFSKSNLVSNPAGGLLQKLSECCVKSADDAELALNVVTSLVASLKEYSKANGEIKIMELLMDAELKIGTVKALKVGMKMLSNFGGGSDSSTAGKASMDLFSGLTQSSVNVSTPSTSAPSNSSMNSLLSSGYHSIQGTSTSGQKESQSQYPNPTSRQGWC